MPSWGKKVTMHKLFGLWIAVKVEVKATFWAAKVK